MGNPSNRGEVLKKLRRYVITKPVKCAISGDDWHRSNNDRELSVDTVLVYFVSRGTYKVFLVGTGPWKGSYAFVHPNTIRAGSLEEMG